jgi:hypothetical protein
MWLGRANGRCMYQISFQGLGLALATLPVPFVFCLRMNIFWDHSTLSQYGSD